METQKLIAVNEDITSAGAIIWWRMSGGLPLAHLTTHWLKTELDEDLLPSPPTPAEALRRACMDIQEKRLLMRALGRGKGYAIVKEIPNEEKESLDHVVVGIVEIDGDADLVFRHPEDGEFPEGLEEMFRARYIVHQQELSTQDISNWVIWLLTHILKAVGLRQRGGIYFVGESSVQTWLKYAETIEWASNHRFFSVPAMHSESAVEAILDAVEQEAQKLALAIQKGIEDGKGKRALRGMEDALTKMELKLEHYEEMLGKKSELFPDLKTEVQAGITKAIMALDMDLDNCEVPL